MKKELAAIMVAALAYSCTAIAYVHASFVTKDIFTMLIGRLDRIEKKIDDCHGRAD